MHENTCDYTLMGAPLYHLQTTSYISLTLSSINVPREVSILYLNNVAKLIAYGKVLRSFRNVNYFIFLTGFNGARTFRRSAPTDVHVYGGGIAIVCLWGCIL